jgi:hypothetical protein
VALKVYIYMYKADVISVNVSVAYRHNLKLISVVNILRFFPHPQFSAICHLNVAIRKSNQLYMIQL